jgi:hypothetical protein
MSEENLYRTPQSPVTEKRSSDDGNYAYRSPRLLANVVRGMIIAMVVLKLGSAAAQFHQLHVLQQMAAHAFASRDEMMAVAQRSDRMVALLAGLSGIAVLIGYVAGGMWIYRVACNARALGARGLDDKPGWAVGWYFIPFMCLARPFRAMEQIWRASTMPQQWQKRTSAPALLRWWWAAWLIFNFGGYLALRTASKSPDIQDLIQQTQITLGLSPVAIAANLLFLVVVSGLTRIQEQQFAQPTPAASPADRDGMDLSWLNSMPQMRPNGDVSPARD